MFMLTGLKPQFGAVYVVHCKPYKAVEPAIKPGTCAVIDALLSANLSHTSPFIKCAALLTHSFAASVCHSCTCASEAV